MIEALSLLVPMLELCDTIYMFIGYGLNSYKPVIKDIAFLRQSYSPHNRDNNHGKRDKGNVLVPRKALENIAGKEKKCR